MRGLFHKLMRRSCKSVIWVSKFFETEISHCNLNELTLSRRRLFMFYSWNNSRYDVAIRGRKPYCFVNTVQYNWDQFIKRSSCKLQKGVISHRDSKRFFDLNRGRQRIDSGYLSIEIGGKGLWKTVQIDRANFDWFWMLFVVTVYEVELYLWPVDLVWTS